MKKIIHKSDSRGHINHGWLDTYHTFSFADYYDRERMNFGALRVLNDDIIAGGAGFGMHPHDNMEIVTIPLRGALEHRDSMGNSGVIGVNEIQIMSAGSGIMHSEFNHNAEQDINLLQIWVLPNKRNVEPRYAQIEFSEAGKKNKLQQLITPNENASGLWLHQDAWFHLADLDQGMELNYTFHKEETGLYLFIIEGEAEVDGNILGPRDGMGIWDANELKIKSMDKLQALFIEVPMKF